VSRGTGAVDTANVARISLAAALIASLLLGAALTASPANADQPGCRGPGWQLVGSANRGDSDNQLRGVSAISRKEAWAAGWYVNPATRSNTALIEHWDGTAWSAALSPGVPGALQAIDASSSDDVWAVGSTITELFTSAALALHWDGRSWEVVDVPRPPGGEFVGTVLTDVVALARDDAWAVGHWSPVPDHPPFPLIEHWDGTEWRVVESPSFETWTELQGVAASGPNDVWAVGNTEVQVGRRTFVERALVEHWDGTSWRVVGAPVIRGRVPYGLAGIDARSRRDAWAVGAGTRGASDFTLSMHWDGVRWTRVRTPNPSDTYQVLADVSLDGPKKAWAVGTVFSEARDADVPLIVRWDGERWAPERTASRPSGNELLGVVARPSYRLTVGSYWANGGDGPQQTMSLRGCRP
jgi:hypothetical protein